ncbi:MAG TPA: tyrosine-type recombinase/integrase [Paludibacteraceae bacterium]|nr:tyrosine-type recombinase/integrase [Paludibacteraceae bacterium]
MATVKYALSNRINNGLSEVHIRFLGGRGVDLRAKSGLFCPPERWSTAKNCVSIPRIRSNEALELSELQRKLDELESYIIKSFLEERTTVSLNWLTDLINSFYAPKQEKSCLFVAEAFIKWIENGHQGERYTANARVVWRAWKRFELYKKTPYYVSDLSADLMSQFEDYLRDEYKIIEKRPEIYEAVSESRKPVRRGDNSLSTLLRKMRTFCNVCVRDGVLQVSPFGKYQLPQELYGTPYYISIEERNQLYNTDLSSHLELAIQRDIFVFQCCVGCRVSDLLGLKKSNIVNGALEYVADKTRLENPQVLRVPLNSIACEIVARYANTDNEKLLPFLSSQKYNNYIKEAFTQANITRLVTVRNSITGFSEQQPINELASSHMARRTFCGNLYKKVKDARLIGSMSGHSVGSRAFARYSEIDDEMKTELVKMLL